MLGTSADSIRLQFLMAIWYPIPEMRTAEFTKRTRMTCELAMTKYGWADVYNPLTHVENSKQ